MSFSSRGLGVARRLLEPYLPPYLGETLDAGRGHLKFSKWNNRARDDRRRGPNTTETPMPVTDQARLQDIERARRAVMGEGRSAADVLVDRWFERSWVERSWRRCLDLGMRPEHRVTF